MISVDRSYAKLYDRHMPTTQLDVIALDAEAVSTSVALLDGLEAADLARPTPCAEWTLRGLLTHMTTQHYGFAAAARGDGGDLGRWRPRRLGGDPVAEYQEAADAVLAAFAEPGVVSREFLLPELAAGLAFPGEQAVSFHLVDYVAHSWDVAKTLGRDVSFSPDAVGVALQVAVIVPDGEARVAPGAPFGPVVSAPGADGLGHFLALLGRDPSWSAPR